MMAKKQFKAESKKLMNLMINSIYTNKEIFLREIISNASDAMDKLYYRSLTDTNMKIDHDDFKIEIVIDKEKRTLTIRDNGCGMTEEELENNLGTIARSGSSLFKEEYRTYAQAEQLMKATVQAFGVKAAKQTRYIKAINYGISEYGFDTVCDVLNSIEATEKLRIEAAKCEDKISCIQHLIIERVIEMRNAQQQ